MAQTRTDEEVFAVEAQASSEVHQGCIEDSLKSMKAASGTFAPETQQEWWPAWAAKLAEREPPVLSEFEELVPPPGTDDEPWVMPVLRTEARLRLGEAYIGQTQKWYDRDSAPPAELDLIVELQALIAHGFGQGELDEYRKISRRLPDEHRQPIFFLRANDRLYRPSAKILERPLEGTLLRRSQQQGVACARTSFKEVLSQYPLAVVVASTSS